MDAVITKNETKWHITTWFIMSLVVLNLFDFGTTYYAMEHMGVEEANPILAYLIEATGTTWTILWFKVIVFGFLFGMYAFVQDFRQRCQKSLLMAAFAALVIGYTVLVASNFSIIFRNTSLLSF